MVRVINTMWKAHTQQTLLESLQVADVEDAVRIVELGKHMTEMAQQLIDSGVIGTARQDEWTPV
jgi:2-keto-3-deoxy-L-rhamnonate aldolase RhmA